MSAPGDDSFNDKVVHNIMRGAGQYHPAKVASSITGMRKHTYHSLGGAPQYVSDTHYSEYLQQREHTGKSGYTYGHK